MRSPKSARELPDARLVVVGSGWWEDSLRAYVAERGLQDAVEFRGHVSEADKHAAYDEAWVLALPSLKEGWGLVVGEAAGHGVPTVAYRSAGGPTESVHDGLSGRAGGQPGRVPCGASPRCCRRRRCGRRLSAGALATAGNFTWSATVRAFDRILTGTSTQEDRPASLPAGH